MKVKSMRGVSLDMNRYLARYAEMPALGNGGMNARGDKIAPGGKIIKKREDVQTDYHRANPKAVRRVALNSIGGEVFASPADAIKAAQGQAHETVTHTPPPPHRAPKRKLTDD